MAKAFILKQEDLDALLTAIDRDPTHGLNGGSSHCLTENERQIYKEAHRFYNFHIRRWIDKVTS